MSIIEIVISLAVTSLTLCAVVFVVESNEVFFISSAIKRALIVHVETRLNELEQAGNDHFDELVSATTSENGIRTSISVEKHGLYKKSIALHAASSVYPNITFDLQTDIYDINHAFGKENCLLDPLADWQQPQIIGRVRLDSTVVGTDVVVQNDTAYLTADSALGSKDDFYVIDVKNPSQPRILSSLNTGPGLKAVAISNGYVYVANTSINGQLQIIDVHNSEHPQLVSSLKLPSSGDIKGTGVSIFYADGLVYLGTTKSDSGEFAIIDVHDPFHPQFLSGFETNTVVNAIVVQGSYAYLATPTQKQLFVVDISDPSHPVQAGFFTASGFETQEGESLTMHEGKLYLGRSVGGFNNPKNHEFFALDISSTTPKIVTSSDIGASVNGIIVVPPLAYLATNDITHEFQLWDSASSSLVSSLTTGAPMVSLKCYKEYLFAVIDDSTALEIITHDH